MNTSAFKVWFGGALAAFFTGFIDGFPVGAPVGGGIAVADGAAHLDLQPHTIEVELIHLCAVPFFTGLADVRGYLQNHPFPNIFAPPTLPTP